MVASILFGDISEIIHNCNILNSKYFLTTRNFSYIKANLKKYLNDPKKKRLNIKKLL